MSDAPPQVEEIQPITLEECPLLKVGPESLNGEGGRDQQAVADLITAFNRAVDQLRLFRRAFGHDLDQDERLVELRQKLWAIRKELTKQHYSIGFIGPTQNGKSTALNYVLDATNPTDQPCREGNADNTTSTMSRIRFGPRGVRLFYMTPQQFAKKREALCLACGLNPESSDEDLLKRLPVRVSEVNEGIAPTLEGGKEILPHDLFKLEQLLKACLTDPDLVGSGSRDVEYARREVYLNYVKDAHRANPLLKEACISFDSPFLPKELELFDLPGPGAKSTIDEWTTRQYLPEMNGVMIFVEATKLGNEVVERLYAQLRSQFRDRVHRRVWIVLTRWDSPQYAALVGDRKDTTFTAIKAAMQEKGLPASQIRFVCSPWYRRSAGFPIEHFQGVLGNDSPYPETLPETDELRQRFTELLDKGGILSLRELVLKTIPHDVREEIKETSAVQLRQVRTQLKERFAKEIRKRTATETQSLQASECEEALKLLLIRMRRELEPFEKAAADLRKDLKETFWKHCRSAEVLDEFHEVPTKFPVHTRILEDRLYNQLQHSIVSQLYGYWQASFEALPNLSVMESPEGLPLTPGEVWRRFAEEDEQGISRRRESFPSFLDARLFAKSGDHAAEGDLERGEAYREMMEEKICLASQQAAHAVRNILQGRGLEIKKELDQLVWAEGTTPKGMQADQSLLDEMGGLAQ